MTLAYYKYKAISHGQTHYFFCSAPGGMIGVTDEFHHQTNLRFIPKRIAEYLEDPNVIVESCSWEEWDAASSRLKHDL